VATVLSRILHHHGFTISHIAGRDKSKAAIIATEIGASCSTLHQIPSISYDLAILALSDDFLLREVHSLPISDIPVVHTAGSVPMNILKSLSKNYGVLYPLQSLRKEMTHIPPVPFLIDANDEKLYDTLHGLAHKISPQVMRADDETRRKLHLAAVWVSNFTNHLYALAQDYCQSAKIPFDFLNPLIQETATRIEMHNPVNVQTGPASRGDVQTMERHLEMLKDFADMKALYIKLSDSIISLKKHIS
jgi:predicted short-subunit dehydrogenase-like oxidoreductase (DUF2520 family)